MGPGADHLRNVPGVETVALADWARCWMGTAQINAVSINGAPPTEDSAWFMNVAPGWLDAMKIPFIDGRDLRASDISPGAKIVNRRSPQY